MDRPPPKGVVLRGQLAAASAKLREVGCPELADVVDEVLAPGAWGWLRNSDPDAYPGASNFSMATTGREKEHIKASAKAVGDKLVERVNEGLRLFITGEFVPEKPRRVAYGTASDEAVLNVRGDEQLRKRAASHCKQVAAEIGWKPTVSGVALAYLRRLYPLPDVNR